jgi:hypothetical protein
MTNTAVRVQRATSSSNIEAKEILSSIPSLRTYLSLCVVSAAVVLLEIVLTRVFAFLLWAHLAFMVVGTALFGFALSGLYLAMRKSKEPISISRSCVSASLSILGIYAVIRFIPFQPWDYSSPINFLYLAAWYASLVLPFFYAGLVVATILGSYPRQAAKLYGFDLLSAAAGALAAVPLMPLLGGESALIFCASLLAVAATISADSKVRLKWALGALAGTLVLTAVVPTYLPLVLHHKKRFFNKARKEGAILATRWSSVSRVDIANKSNPTKKAELRAIWIDGGTNHSGMIKVTTPIDEMEPMTKSSVGIAYALKRGTNPNDIIIGSSGGHEVLYALTNGAGHVDAVELDPSIVKFVNDPEFASYMGNLYQNPRVTLHNDEGRAYLRRQPLQSYDVIQFVNNYTPVAIGSGALNLTESYLLTKEAVKDFYDHLKPNGILALHRGATLRVASTALAMLEEQGIANPEQSLLILSGEWEMFETFLLKKGVWTQEEINNVTKYMEGHPRPTKNLYLWNPLDRAGSDPLYTQFITAPPAERAKSYTSLGINLFPTTDDRPFMEHYLQFGKRRLADNIPSEFRVFNSQKLFGIIPRGDVPYVAILVESVAFAFCLVLAPLMWRNRSAKVKGVGAFSTYYAALGFGFMLVELCLMKRYVIYLGSPAYSITAVLVLLLLGAGIGSLSLSKIANLSGPSRLWIIVGGVAAAIGLESVCVPPLMQATLSLVMWQRFAVAAACLLPLGFALGIPFSAGMHILNSSKMYENDRQTLLAWAWGMNGLFTVIGSALTIFLALFYGFAATLTIATCAYVFAAVVLYKISSQSSRGIRLAK